MTSSHPTPAPCQWFSQLAALDRRSAPKLALLFLSAVLARGRRTVTTWIRAAKLSGHYRRCYIAVAAAGERADGIARRLPSEVIRPLLKGATRLALAESKGSRRIKGVSRIKGVRQNRVRSCFADPQSSASPIRALWSSNPEAVCSEFMSGLFRKTSPVVYS